MSARRQRDRPRADVVDDHDGFRVNNGYRVDGNVVKTSPWYPDHAVYNATKDELKAMAEFKYSN